MSGHTSGPWVLQPETFSPRIFVLRANAGPDEPAIASVLDRRDAQLIASAPELLRELEHAIELIEKYVPAEALGTNWMGDPSVPGGTMGWNNLDEHLHYMRAAITKATGGAS